MVGCITLVGQTFMHSPQRMQLPRNSFSETAPGGRTNSGLKFRLPANTCPLINSPAPIPATPAASKWRRPKSIFEPLLGALKNPVGHRNKDVSPWALNENVIAPVGHPE
jgi:hypothetical protein